MNPIKVEGLTDDEARECNALLGVWEQKRRRNMLRTKYYDGRNDLKDLGISIPPSLKNVETVVGWAAKSVDVLAARSMFDGFVAPGGDDDPLGVKDILDENQFDFLYAQAVTSELIHSCSFITVTAGGDGDPDVLIALRSAEYAAALWDFRRRRIRSALAIVDMTSQAPHEPTMMTLYTDTAVVTCVRNASKWVVVDRQANPLGRPLIEPLVFQPSDRRPFGRSRITREVMSIIDSSVRASLRAEVLMEFNTAPQRYLLGADEDAFKDSKWRAYISQWLAISKDEDGDKPEIGQMPQVTPQGAISYLQHLASRFAGATGIPLSSLGIVQDNPASAQAMAAARDDLVTTAQAMNRVNRIALGNVARMALALRDGVGLGDLPEQARRLQARFRNPAMPSVVSQSDAMVKQISAIPWLADTTVALEELGYDESQITRLLSDKRRAEGPGVLAALRDRASAVPVAQPAVERAEGE